MESSSSSKLVGRRAEYQARMEQRRSDLSIHFGRIFGSGAEFTWELGCGHGHFLTAYAQAHPHKLCIGIDIMGERVERALRKRDRAKLDNLFFIHAEGRLFLEMLPAGVAFTELFILFPDPWPKLRHQKHRILQPQFLSAAAKHSTDRGRLYFRTDYQPYFEATRALMRAHSDWQLADEPWPFEFDTVFQSRAPNHQSLIARRVRHATYHS